MPENRSSILAAAKSTLIGGAIFLIPGCLVFFVLAKAFALLRSLAAGLGSRLGVAGPLGLALLDVAAIAVVLLVCFLAGRVARRATAQRLRNKIDEMLLGSFPGYAFVKGMTENMQHSQDLATSFLPVWVSFDDFSQVAFETGRLPGDLVAVYLPGAPNPWSGSVVFVLAERVGRLPVPVTEVLKMIRTLGRGSETLAAEIRTLQSAVR